MLRNCGLGRIVLTQCSNTCRNRSLLYEKPSALLRRTFLFQFPTLTSCLSCPSIKSCLAYFGGNACKLFHSQNIRVRVEQNSAENRSLHLCKFCFLGYRKTTAQAYIWDWLERSIFSNFEGLNWFSKGFSAFFTDQTEGKRIFT